METEQTAGGERGELGEAKTGSRFRKPFRWVEGGKEQRETARPRCVRGYHTVETGKHEPGVQTT